MKTIEATYRIVTPMFCAGADQCRAELRLSSFKGALRFWWRSLAWGRGLRDPKELWEAEAELFGSSGKTGRSRIILRSAHPEPGAHVRTQRAFRVNTWQGYAGFGITDSKVRPKRDYIGPGSRWTIQLLDGGLRSGEVEQIRAALVALGMLGGLGARSRKGWGSLTLTRLVDGTENEGSGAEWRVPRTREEIRRALEQLFHVNECSSELPGWTAITSRASFAIGPAKESADEAHRYLVERYRNAVRSITGKSKPLRESFGLPRKNAGKNSRDRRASPVFLHVHQVEEGEAIPVAAVLPADFLPAQREPAGGWRYLEDFLNSVAG